MSLGKLAYEHTWRGYTVRCWYGVEPLDDAHIEITKGDEMVQRFDYPSYYIWNIAAHFPDIVDSLESSPNPTGGVSAWTN